jgi:hypothetical protein
VIDWLEVDVVLQLGVFLLELPQEDIGAALGRGDKEVNGADF